MALSSLKWKPDARAIDENKQGYIVYSGSPHDFHEWVFRSRIEILGAGEEKKAEKMSQIIKNLRGLALECAKAIEPGDLLKKDGTGLDKLIDGISLALFPIKSEEAKTLYTEFHKIGGILSRQHGESVVSYDSRRTRAEKLMAILSPATKIDPEQKADLYLDNAGITEIEKQLLLTSIDHVKDQEKIKEKLLFLHSKKHIREKHGQFKPKPHHKPFGRGKGKRPPWPKHTGNMADGYVDGQDDGYYDGQDETDYPDWWQEHYGDSDSSSSYGGYDPDSEATGSPAGEYSEGQTDDSDDWEFVENEVEAQELETLLDLEDEYPDGVTDAHAAEATQMACVAFMAFGKGRGRRKGARGKGAGKGSKPGKGKGKRFPTRRGNVSLEERKARLKKLKQTTRCTACGEMGHWAGDPECKAGKQKPGAGMALCGPTYTSAPPT